MNWLTFWSIWFHPSFKWICAARSLAFHVVFCRSLFVHFRVAIVLSVHLQFTAFDYPFAHYIVWPLGLRRPSWSWRMVVGFTTTCTIRAYHHKSFEFESCSGEVYSIPHYATKLVGDLRQVGRFLRVFRFPPPIKPTATI